MKSTIGKAGNSRAYWLDLAIVAIAVLAFALGLRHRPHQPSVPVVADPPRAAGSLPGPTVFSIDTVSLPGASRTLGGMGTSTVAAHRGDVVRLTGWAVDQAERAPASGLAVRVDDGKIFTASYGSDRPDVARVLGDPAYRYSGFTARLEAPLAPGPHRVSLLIYARRTGGGYYLERNCMILEVR